MYLSAFSTQGQPALSAAASCARRQLEHDAWDPVYPNR
jgi:hypothetical protein